MILIHLPEKHEHQPCGGELACRLLRFCPCELTASLKPTAALFCQRWANVADLMAMMWTADCQCIEEECWLLDLLSAVSFIIKTKEEEAPMLKTSTALQCETTDEEDNDDGDDGKNSVVFLLCVSNADLLLLHL